MKGFIEVTVIPYGNRVLLPLPMIKGVEDKENSCGDVFILTETYVSKDKKRINRSGYFVKESYSEIFAKIKAATK